MGGEQESEPAVGEAPQEAEQERQAQQKELEGVIGERDILGAQLIRRNEELALLYEKIKIQQSTLQKGEIQYNDRLREVERLRGEIRKTKADVALARTQVTNVDGLKREVHHLSKTLLREEAKLKALQEEMANPMNVHRWRELEGSDPQTYEMIQKVKSLQKLLISKTEEVVEKDSLIQEKEKLYVQLKSIIARQPGPEVAEQLAWYSQNLKDKTRHMKQMAEELESYHMRVGVLKDEIDRHNKDLSSIKQAYFQRQTSAEVGPAAAAVPAGSMREVKKVALEVFGEEGQEVLDSYTRRIEEVRSKQFRLQLGVSVGALDVTLSDSIVPVMRLRVQMLPPGPDKPALTMEKLKSPYLLTVAVPVGTLEMDIRWAWLTIERTVKADDETATRVSVVGHEPVLLNFTPTAVRPRRTAGWILPLFVDSLSGPEEDPPQEAAPARPMVPTKSVDSLAASVRTAQSRADLSGGAADAVKYRVVNLCQQTLAPSRGDKQQVASRNIELEADIASFAKDLFGSAVGNHGRLPGLTWKLALAPDMRRGARPASRSALLYHGGAQLELSARNAWVDAAGASRRLGGDAGTMAMAAWNAARPVLASAPSQREWICSESYWRCSACLRINFQRRFRAHVTRIAKKLVTSVFRGGGLRAVMWNAEERMRTRCPQVPPTGAGWQSLDALVLPSFATALAARTLGWGSDDAGRPLGFSEPLSLERANAVTIPGSGLVAELLTPSPSHRLLLLATPLRVHNQTDLALHLRFHAEGGDGLPLQLDGLAQAPACNATFLGHPLPAYDVASQHSDAPAPAPRDDEHALVLQPHAVACVPPGALMRRHQAAPWSGHRSDHLGGASWGARRPKGPPPPSPPPLPPPPLPLPPPPPPP
ncbi:unnamed protein product, partial [Prorocentrum cordatum]